ncbi:farnesol dehydrogenase-like [Ostrinia furnacalis]|uniref:farnesol dehydrogenase-like n=1 Tax=Ostrinia furnacalis TaxID=93504 RepID=UPI00103EED1A|nr:farnesol dehydrogenase-like [Ostrinia furnacalis]
MDFWKNKVAVVTGACHGIGAQITEDLVRIGMIVIGFEPSNERVNQMFDKLESWGKVEGQLIPCQCDISNDEDLKIAFEGIVAAYGGVDVLVNNAAIGKEGLISTGNIEDLQKVTDVNIYGLIACTKFAIESMTKKDTAGQIININSICGHYMPPFAEPKINMYIASKRTMTVLNTLLKNEFKHLNRKIKVTSVSPGIVRTGIFKTAGIEFLNEEFFNKNPHLTTKDVSNVVLMILSAPRSIQVNEVIFHALHEIY